MIDLHPFGLWHLGDFLRLHLGIVILCVFPQIALWLPDVLMGPGS